MNIKVIEDNIDFDEFNNLLERSKIVIYNSNNLIKFHLIDYLLINKVLFLTIISEGEEFHDGRL